MTELESLAHEIGVNERTLRRAVGQGTLRAARTSPRKLELSIGERLYARRFWSLLGRLRRALRTERNVRFALLFGSFAEGTATPDSDIDLLVDLRDASLERVFELEERLARTMGRRVEVVSLEGARRDPAFFTQAVTQGRVLVDRERLWPRLSRSVSRQMRAVERRQDRRAEEALAGIDRLLAA